MSEDGSAGALHVRPTQLRRVADLVGPDQGLQRLLGAVDALDVDPTAFGAHQRLVEAVGSWTRRWQAFGYDLTGQLAATRDLLQAAADGYQAQDGLAAQHLSAVARRLELE